MEAQAKEKTKKEKKGQVKEKEKKECEKGQKKGGQSSSRMKKEDSSSKTSVEKHPLQYTWSYWFYENVRGRSWEENQNELTSFNTVEDFWCVFNYVLPVNKWPNGCDCSLFKSGIRPMWEDESNQKGGRWLLCLDAKQRSKLHTIWMDLVLYLVGRCFDEYGDEVCGAVLSIRQKTDKISVWTSDISHKDEILKIGEGMKTALELKDDIKIRYESHEVAEKKQSKNMCLFTM